MRSFLRRTYGADRELCARKRKEYLTALRHYAGSHDPDDSVFIVRSPGRINLMGRHVDHRGGDVNVVAISDECLAVVSPREDDIVELSNAMPDRFGDHRFSIGALADSLELSNWFSCVNSPKTLALVKDGDWDNYIKAAALRLQQRFNDRVLKGMKMTVHSDIPIGSGLSSSSALVVAAAEALVAINDLPVEPHLLVDLCGEGEWFVGTRGGSGDHAAIKLGRRGEVVNMGFFPFRVKGFVPFPAQCRIVIVDSGIQAKKMEGARAEFNGRILAYLAGEIFFKRAFPEYADQIEHLRDITPGNLGVSEARFYEMLLDVPHEVESEELNDLAGGISDRDRERVETILATDTFEHRILRVRDSLLYGVAEVERSRLCASVLEAEDMETFGRLCRISHDGDRVCVHDATGARHPWDYEVSDEYLRELANRCSSGMQSAAVHWQPGRYACSLPEIDRIVDLAGRMNGCFGAQMAGAGLGGCVMVFVDRRYCDGIVARFRADGFDARAYTPVNGAGIASLAIS